VEPGVGETRERETDCGYSVERQRGSAVSRRAGDDCEVDDTGW